LKPACGSKEARLGTPDPMSATFNPIVSVVIPAYNAATFIETTLESVRTQTFTRYEIVVVDDGSSDETASVVERYLGDHHLDGRCVRQENQGIAAARNAGMRAARTDYIALLDHDDLWYPTKLDVVMREFDSHTDVDLVCHSENITRGGNHVRVSRYGPVTDRLYERMLFAGRAPSPSATTFGREKALAIGGFLERADYHTVEDYDFWMRLSRVAKFRFLDDEILAEYVLVDRAASRDILLHHVNLEIMLSDHFRQYLANHRGALATLRVRKRLSIVYRSAASQLMARGEKNSTQLEFVQKMLHAYPLEPRNIAVALKWLLRTSRHPRAQQRS
jgi:glycosyltransferase involved in cell wall biosynthesis